MIAFVPRIALGFVLCMLAGSVKADVPLPAGAAARLRIIGRATAVALSRDGRIAFTAADDGTIHRWDALTGREHGRYLGHKAEVVGLLLAPDGRTVYSQSKDNTLRAWDVASSAQRWRRDGVDGFWCRPTLSPDGKTLAAAGSSNILKLFEAATGKSLHNLPAKSGGGICAVVFAADSSTVFALTYRGPVCRWQTAGGRPLPDLMLPPDPIKVYT